MAIYPWEWIIGSQTHVDCIAWVFYYLGKCAYRSLVVLQELSQIFGHNIMRLFRNGVMSSHLVDGNS